MSQQNRQLTPAEVEKAKQELQKMKPEERNALLKELEKELQSETSKEAAPLLEFILKNIRKIIIALVAVVILIALTNYLQYRSEQELTDAQAELSQISTMQDLYVKLDALEAFAIRAPEELQVAIIMEEINSSIPLEEYDFAIAKMKVLIELEKNNALGVSMTFALSDLLVKIDRLDEALMVLEDFLEIAPKDDKNTVLEEIAITAELMGNIDRAVAAYTELLAQPDLIQTHQYYQERVNALTK